MAKSKHIENVPFGAGGQTIRAQHSRPAPSEEGLEGLEHDVNERIQFLHSFLKEPASIGALSPSSRSLAEAMIDGLRLDRADTVVELGPGTGAFTSLILERMNPNATFIALELNRTHAARLSKRFRNVNVYHDSAEKIASYLQLHGKKKANYVISGIPWANLKPSAQQHLMQAILGCLAKQGAFTTFAYVHARWFSTARRFRQILGQHFSQVGISPVVWDNLPPAFVYQCTRPLN